MRLAISLSLALGLTAGSVLAGTGTGTVTFIHFNDLHAHLTPHTDLVPAPENGPDATRIVEHGGLARAATLIKQIRATNPRSVLMNIGDTYHGGVEALYTRGNAIVAPMNLLGVDVGVPGNWDFAYGPAVTRARFGSTTPLATRVAEMLSGGEIARPNYPNLAANARYSTGLEFLPATLIKDLNGVKVGFIGLTSDIVAEMSPALAIGFTFIQGEAAYKTLIERHAAALRAQNVDLVVVMSELGIHKDHRLAQIVRRGSVDVFFSAHTHEATFTPLTSTSGALVVEAGNDGYLGRMDITVRQGRVSDRRWTLLEIGATIPDDARVARAVAAARAPFLADNVAMSVPMPGVEQTLTRRIDTVVGYTAQPLDRRHALESSFNNFVTDMLRTAAGTQLALAPGFRFDSPLPAPAMLLEDNTVATGAITLEDVYRYFPVVYTLAIGQTDGAGLRNLLEGALTQVYSSDAFRQAGGWTPGLSGLRADVDLSKPDGQRVLTLSHTDGSPILPDEKLVVAGCRRPVDTADTLCGYTGFSNITPLLDPATGKPYTAADFFVHALAAGYGPAAARDSLHDVSATPVWPAAPFVQPLP